MYLQWCLDCTNWKEASEPGITPIATPNGNLAPDEELEVALDERESNIFDLEGGSGSDVSLYLLCQIPRIDVIPG